MNGNNPHKTAIAVLKKYRLKSVTLEALVRVAEDMNYSVLDFSKQTQNGASETLLQELGLSAFAKYGKSFLYKKKDVQLIFLCEEMSAEEKRYALAHELGHICCGHLKNGTYSGEADMREEYEANEFAHYLLHPGKLEKLGLALGRHRAAVILAAIAAVFIVALSSVLLIQQSRSYYGKYYVSEKGLKYHAADCSMIKDKTNTHRLTTQEYESGKYEPCSLCLPESDGRPRAAEDS